MLGSLNKHGDSLAYAEKYTCDGVGESCLALTHKSGLKIMISEKKRSTVSCVFAVRYGAIDTDIGSDKPRETPAGVAHFLEHQLFTRPDGGDWQEDFSSVGAEVNAYTSYDRTAYTFSTTNGYEKPLELLLTMVFHPTFTPKSVKKERGIIAEEIRMNADSPWERVYFELLRLMYPAHPVREDICGSLSSIRRITPELLYECHGRFYKPQNAVLSICGDVDVDSVIAICDNIIPDTYSTNFVKPRRKFDKNEKMSAKEKTVKLPSQKPVFCIGIRDTAGTMEGSDLLKRDVTMALLGEMLFSRTAPFYNRMLEDGFISPDFSHSTAIGEGFAFFSIIGEADEPWVVFEKFKEHIASVRESGLSDADFLRNRRIMYADFVTALDTTDDISNTMMNYAIDGLSPFDFIDAVKKIKQSDVEDMLASVMREESLAFSVALPKNNGG